MFLPILRFELAYHLRRPVTWLYFAVLLLLAFFLVASEAVSLTGGVGQIKRNSPYPLAEATVALTLIGQVFTVAILGTSLLRDVRFGAHELLYTTRMTRLGYLGGRFVGGFLVTVLVYTAIPLGTLVGSFAPWVDAEFLTAVNPWWHVQPFLLLAIPTLLVTSAIFFAVGALSRSLVVVYTQGIALIVAYSVADSWLGDLENDTLANALDPFALATIELTTRYWTVAERNALTVPMDGWMLTNRAIWIGVALVIAAVTFALFRFEVRAQKPAKRRKAAEGDEGVSPAAATTTAPRSVEPTFAPATVWRQLAATTGVSFRHIVRDKLFVALALIAGINTFMNAWYVDSLYGVTTWPITFLVGEIVAGGFIIFAVLLSTIYAGEAVWRERTLGADQLVDASPVDTWVLMAGKITSVVLAITLLLVAMIPAGIIAQLAKGFTRVEPGLYLAFVFGTSLPWTVAIVLFAFGVHALAQNKFMGHVALIVYWIGSLVLANLGFEHQLFSVGWTPYFVYSDMNGFGHFVSNLALSAGYSLSFGLMATVLALLTWVRGSQPTRAHRLEAAKRRWSARTRVAMAGCGALVLVFGGAIFYNTNVLNEYSTSDDREEDLAEWERTYRRYLHLAPPRVVDVDVTLDIRPEDRGYTRDGRFIMVNKEDEPIDSVLVNFPEAHELERMEWSTPARLAIDDGETGTRLYVFEEPLAPGDTTVFSYRYGWAADGFPNSGWNNRIAANGTFLTGAGPSFGYDESSEMSDPADRRKYGLPPRDRLPDLDDVEARRNSQFRIDADLVRFATTIGTAPDQIAVAPGYLVREWEEDGRRWFRYEMDRPIAHFVSFVSARYTVTRDRWRDVEIEVYHHDTHTFNVERMVESVKASLEYFTENFSPYQHRVVRVVEFPRWFGFAQSFATTIPYSEGIGFITRVKDEDDDLDMPFFVTAHEVAHQWWGHQVAGARVQGSALMVESMAEYSALTVMEKRYGPSHARKFLRHELDRYLRGRAGERIREQPLLRVENQAYIHYYKGSLALYALRDYIGEEAMNRGLQAYLADHAFEEAPYSTSRDFISYLRAETPDSLQHVIEDLFETITLWDNRVEDVSATERDDGRWAVTIDYTARKVRADSLGTETEIPMADYVDVGVFGEPEPGNALGRPLSVFKILVESGPGSVEIVVDERPQRVGIDPYNKLIDRVPDDNVDAVPGG